MEMSQLGYKHITSYIHLVLFPELDNKKEGKGEKLNLFEFYRNV